MRISNSEKKFKEKTSEDFNTFYNKYHPKLLWELMTISQDKDEAREICDDAFIKALDEIDKYHKVYTIKANIASFIITDKTLLEKSLILDEAIRTYDQMCNGIQFKDLEGSLSFFEENIAATLEQLTDQQASVDVQNYNIETLGAVHLGKWIKRWDSSYSNDEDFDNQVFGAIWNKKSIGNETIKINDLIETETGYHIIEIIDFKTAEFSTWLFIIGKRLMFQRLKDKQKFESVDEDHNGATISNFLISDDKNIENEERISESKSEFIKSKIPELKPQYSKVLTMRHVDNLTYSEIARSFDRKCNIRDNNNIDKEIRFDYNGIDLRSFTDFEYEQEILGKVVSMDSNHIYLSLNSDRRKVELEEINYMKSCGIQSTLLNMCTKNEIEVFKFEYSKVSNCYVSFNLSTIKSQIKKGREMLRKKVEKVFKTVDFNDIYSYN